MTKYLVIMKIVYKFIAPYCFPTTSFFPLMSISSMWALIKQRQKSSVIKCRVKFYRVCPFLTLALIPPCQESLECQDFLQNLGHPLIKKESCISLTHSHANEYQGQIGRRRKKKKERSQVMIFPHIIRTYSLSKSKMCIY